MIKHIVCFKLKDNSEKNCNLTKDILFSMKGKVPTIKNIDVNVNQLNTDRSYDIILEIVVDSWAALEEYQNDPYHCNIVKKHMHAVRENSIALDFEINE